MILPYKQHKKKLIIGTPTENPTALISLVKDRILCGISASAFTLHSIWASQDT